MRFARVSLLILLLPFLTPSLYAADIEAGEKRAAQCFGCHGADGISLNPLYPNLGGQSAEYLIKQLNAFRSGERADAFMTPMFSGLSDIPMLKMYRLILPARALNHRHRFPPVVKEKRLQPPPLKYWPQWRRCIRVLHLAYLLLPSHPHL